MSDSADFIKDMADAMVSKEDLRALEKRIAALERAVVELLAPKPKDNAQDLVGAVMDKFTAELKRNLKGRSQR